MRVEDPAEEKQSHHHSGAGQGPVQPDEFVLFAVFEKTPREGNRLTADAFPQKQIKKAELSLARLSYTSRETFEQKVVAPLQGEMGALVGVACVLVRELRQLEYTDPHVRPNRTGQAVCVLDKVSKDDHEGHAALSYPSWLSQSLTPKQLATARQLIAVRLAEKFGEIRPIDEVFPAA